jgi:hypothetical protein
MALVSYLSTYTDPENFQVIKTGEFDFSCHKDDKAFVAVKPIEKQCIDTHTSKKTQKTRSFAQWLAYEKADNKNRNIDACFNKLFEENMVDLELLQIIAEEKEIKYLPTDSDSEEYSIGENSTVPIALKKAYLVRKVGNGRYTKFFVHSRLVILYVSSISAEFAAEVSGVFDRYLRGDLTLVTDVIQRKNKNTGMQSVVVVTTGGNGVVTATAFESESKTLNSSLATQVVKIKKLTKNKKKTREKQIADRIAEELKGNCEVCLDNGKRIDIVSEDTIIEVKKYDNAHHAIGQILYYHTFYQDHDMRIHLFNHYGKRDVYLTKCCNELNITITYE